jgi:hypothetical protein
MTKPSKIVSAQRSRQVPAPQTSGQDAYRSAAATLKSDYRSMTRLLLRNPLRICGPPQDQQFDFIDSFRTGWGGIRTHDTLARMAVFKTAALNRSATHPQAQATAASRAVDNPTGPLIYARAVTDQPTAAAPHSCHPYHKGPAI